MMVRAVEYNTPDPLQRGITIEARELREENERLREALTFYADQKNYEAADPYTADGSFRAWGDQMNYVPDDKGHRARSALNPETGK